ncbi:spermidine synthase [Paenibacillus sp. FSL H8-0548]|uniref:spermidine synthase n=1 Tax=Paenibacillus sp. FSL H8-0548 TaxID=1920422 RepID=UPI00096FBB63|nr:fused MFS/spermidine synthase [Paenibacillus sp. FSL H8-0548]OMF22539.1 spermidine synthase [Paenibacillus sp. FSL H8-0548]
MSGLQEIAVYDSNQLYGQVGKYRFLQFSNEAIQGAIDLKNPGRIVMEYPRAIIHLMEWNDRSFENVFMIGHGIGTIAGHYSDKRFTIAEINEKVVELSKAYFHYRSDDTVIGDGRQILCDQAPAAFDYIVVDAFTKEGTPYHFTTLEFFQLTREKLTASGAVIMNLMGKIKNDKLINAIYTTFREVYPYTKAFSLPAEDAADIRNIIVMGSSKAIDYESRVMAGFFEIELAEGHRMLDKE